MPSAKILEAKKAYVAELNTRSLVLWLALFT